MSSYTRLHNNYTQVASVVLRLDLETKDHKITVYHLLEGIGTIGGLFELLFGGILAIYISIRKNLYYFSFLTEFNKFKRIDYGTKIDSKINQTHHKTTDHNASRGKTKDLRTVENKKLLNNHDESKVVEESKMPISQFCKSNMEYSNN